MTKASFTDQVYNKARKVVSSQQFEADWQDFITKTVMVGSLLASDGPDAAHAGGIDELRTRVNQGTNEKGGERSAIMGFFAGGTSRADEVIVPAAKGGKPANSWAERAATLKMLKHFYRASQRGSQDVWIYSPPTDFNKWIFDEISGAEFSIKRKLRKEAEVYTDDDKKVMCEALQTALACAQETVTSLGAADKKTREAVRRWFADESTTEEQTTQDIATLLAGFKKISNVCNSNKLVFSDDPADRKSTSKYNNLYGSVFPGGEGLFPVIYLAGAFKKSGSTGKLWLCAQTIIHEASHIEVRTEDHRYDSAGLKPDSVFPRTEAINNADSWGYFSIDLCGYLSNADRMKVLI